MSKLIVCSVFDSKVSAFHRPMFFRTRGEAVRSWESAVNDPETGDVFRYPEDFSMMEIGSFEEGTGVLCSLATPVNLGLAASFRRPKDASGADPVSAVRSAAATAVDSSRSRSN